MVRIDSNKFRRFEKVRISGKTNMFDLIMVTKLARLTKAEYLDIQKNYSLYKDKFLK